MDDFSEDVEYKYIKNTAPIEIKLLPCLCKEEYLKRVSKDLQEIRKNEFDSSAIYIPPIKITCLEHDHENDAAVILLFGNASRIIKKDKKINKSYKDLLEQIHNIIRIFRWEFITTDITSNILREVEEKHPVLIESLKQKENYLNTIREVLRYHISYWGTIQDIVFILEYINQSYDNDHFLPAYKIYENLNCKIQFMRVDRLDLADLKTSIRDSTFIMTASSGHIIGFSYKNDSLIISFKTLKDTKAIIEYSNEKNIPVFAEEQYVYSIFDKYERGKTLKEEDFDCPAKLCAYFSKPFMKKKHKFRLFRHSRKRSKTNN